MDIAKIRKKAQAQGKAKQQSSAAEPVQEQVATPEADAVEVPAEAADLVVSVEAEAVFEEYSLATVESMSGLDRLFAVTDAFTLSADNSDLLDGQDSSVTHVSRQYLSFHLSDEEYALDITVINEIIKVREFTEIPRSPDYVLGIISLRGVVVPVFDLRNRLNLGVSELTLNSRIVVCLLGDTSVGFLVDSINQVVNLIDDELEPPPGVLAGLDREMLSGIGRYQGRMIILLNLKSVLALESN